MHTDLEMCGVKRKEMGNKCIENLSMVEATAPYLKYGITSYFAGLQ